MATLTSWDLRSRLVLQPRGYQFQTADNLYDLNWIDVVGRLVAVRSPGRIVRTRLATWELSGIAAHCEQVARGERALWQPRFFDSGLHMWVRRSAERVDICQVTAVLSPITGPLPSDMLQHWHGDRLFHPDGLEGLRFSCSRPALLLFAEELRLTMRAWPTRTVQATGT